MAIDPVRRELIKNALITIADNMIMQVVRTSRSTVVKNSLDFSASICDAQGNTVAQGLALPGHLGATMPALAACLRLYEGRLRPGDILANNDPYSGASHLNDIFMFAPVFSGGRVIAYLSLVIHHTDMGGRVPGGNATDSTEIYQEGLRLPPLLFHEAGVPNETAFRILEANVRMPERMLGDIRAQIAALTAGVAAFEMLLAEQGASVIETYMADLIAYAEALTRASIAALPDGTATFVDYNDDDGTGGDPVRLKVRLTIRGDEIEADFTGTSPQTSGATNPNFWFTASLTYAALRTIMPMDLPTNAGFYRPIRLIVPEGSFLNPRFPAPVGARGQSGYRLRSLVLGALAQLVPGRIPACTGGSEFSIVIAGRDPADEPFLMLEYHNVTGHGGGPATDGQDAGPFCLGNLANVPVEVQEAENPVLIEEYAFIPDSAGPGEFRGSLGIARQYRLLDGEALLQVRSDRQKFPPYGLFGGDAGGPGRTFLAPAGGQLEPIPAKVIRQISAGEVYRVEMPGSGGYGPAVRRDPARVAEDVRQGKLSIAHAARHYGVCCDAGGKVDAEATRRLRAAMAETTEEA
ncbi:MAG: hypothetical protein BGN87_01945 [Rhizobiales bacterium 65-79]|jgi:N-methylhydantoinase B|nr:hydantoinase B/oxoprolinase family protein [Hyphomicrobiales bacterium]OJU05789.1 MAG: hypothetical protein BGN87_01945 [Rhizobiales bacterium 65-79]